MQPVEIKEFTFLFDECDKYDIKGLLYEWWREYISKNGNFMLEEIESTSPPEIRVRFTQVCLDDFHRFINESQWKWIQKRNDGFFITR